MSKSEYSDQFTWKISEIQHVDVSEKIKDHLNPVAPLPKYNWKSEYMNEYSLEKLNLKSLKTVNYNPKLKSDGTQTPKELMETSPSEAKPTPKDASGHKDEIEKPSVRFETEKVAEEIKKVEPKEQPQASPTEKPQEGKTIEKPIEAPAPQADLKAAAKVSKEPASSIKNRPIMAQYGIGNVKPVVPEYHMKTFNMRAPPSEIYPNTRLHGMRIKHFNEKELESKKPLQNIGVVPDPNEALRQYMKAKDLVLEIQRTYKTEYQRNYVNWNLPMSEIRKQLGEDEPKSSSKENVPPVIPAALNGQHKPPIPTEKPKEAKEIDKSSSATPKSPVPTKSKSVFEQILEKGRTAGLASNDIKTYNEKRHFEEELGTRELSFKLAQDVFERASSRASNRL